jgi:ParB-like chromosome segregation protein Spo0J
MKASMVKEHNWKRQELPLGDVRERPDFQLRVEGVSDAHARVLERTFRAGGDLEPIKVARINRGLFVVDGFHRLQAARAAGRETITAEVARLSLDEARSYALLANTQHGKRLTPKDKARIFARYVELRKHLDPHGATKSSRVIAAELNHVYSHQTVLTKLKALGIELDDADANRKPWHRGELDVAELAQEVEEEAWDALEAFRSAMGALDPSAQQELLGAARKLVEALERGERIERVREEPEVLLDI